METPKTVSRYVCIEFANPAIKAIDHIDDLDEAVKYAGEKLYNKHQIKLHELICTDDNEVVLPLDIPEDMAYVFCYGHYLRIITNYLLDVHDLKYKCMKTAKGLLTYVPYQIRPRSNNRISTTERFEAIASFSKLLQRNDDESLNRIKKIIDILRS